MVDIAYYLVTKEIAKRCNLIGHRYVAKDGRFILDNNDLSRMRLTTEEFINGIVGAEMISHETARELIAENGHTFQTNNEQ